MEWTERDPNGALRNGISPASDPEVDVCITPRTPQGIEDSAFITHARHDIPALLAEVERLARLAPARKVSTMPDQPRHRPVTNPDGTFTWCATCIDPACDQLHEQWPCAVQRLTDSLAADGTIVPQDVAERATAAAASSHAAALRSAEAVSRDLARQLDACAAADDDER